MSYIDRLTVPVRRWLGLVLVASLLTQVLHVHPVLPRHAAPDAQTTVSHSVDDISCLLCDLMQGAAHAIGAAALPVLLCAGFTLALASSCDARLCVAWCHPRGPPALLAA